MKLYLSAFFVVIVFANAYSETLFEVKDASNQKVLDISTDGLRVMNQGDTLMVISSNEIKANISSSKGLSRTFSVTTNAAKGSGKDLMRLTSDSTRFWISDTGSGFGVASQTTAGKSVATNFLKVSNANTEMREGDAGNRYTDFSPDNIFLGLNAGILTEPSVGEFFDLGSENVFLGNNSGVSNTEGSHGVFIGSEAGYFNDTGFGNVFIGQGSGRMNTSSSLNTYVGTFAGYNSTGIVNTYIGFESGYSNTTGSGNTFVGRSTGRNTLTGGSNTVVGTNAFTQSEGSSNTILGAYAGRGSISGDFQENVFVGQSSGYKKLSGYQNVYIGNSSGYNNETGYGNIFIGNRSGFNETGSNKLYIDNSTTSTPLIYGDFETDFIKINGELGVGINPSYKIHVVDETTYNDNPAIFGKHNVSDTYGVGVKGEGGLRGVAGYAYATGDYHIHGVSGSAYGSGGVRTGVYGTASGGTVNWAGYFSGNVYVTGNLNANDYIEFKSDHPTDPENKILSHSSVSSSEMLNVYSGNVVLDEKGNATVQMPDWFESYNAEFRYQLTGIGSSAPGLFISKKLTNGEFGIGGGNPSMEVSWMITAVRNDNLAKANPFQVVSDKKDNEKGYYLTPEVFGKSKDRGIESMYEKEAEKERKK